MKPTTESFKSECLIVKLTSLLALSNYLTRPHFFVGDVNFNDRLTQDFSFAYLARVFARFLSITRLRAGKLLQGLGNLIRGINLAGKGAGKAVHESTRSP